MRLLFLTVILAVADGMSRPRVEVQPRDIIVATHNINITIYCVTSGDPKPTVEWFYDGEFLEIQNYGRHFTLTNDGSLHISEVSREDEGEYQCIASNAMGVVMSDKAIVKFPYLNKFTHGDSALTLDEGKPLKLKCYAPESFPSRDVYWSKFVFGMPNNRVPLPPSSHYSVGNDGDLYFASLRQSDSGYYTCVVSNVMLSLHVIRTVALTVTPVNGDLQPTPVQIFPEFSDVKLALKGKEFALECIAAGSNIPSISIKKKGSGIELGKQQGNRAVHVIKEFSEGDEGKYRCKVGKKARMSTQVKMEAAPHWVILPSDGKADINGSFTWPCLAAGNPQPHYEWYFNSELLLPNERYTFSGGNITIRGLKHADSGIYQCIAINKYGELTTAMELTVRESPAGFGPGSRKPTNAHALTGTTAELVCNPSGAPQPTVQWKFGRRYLQNGGKYTILPSGNLLIHKVSATDAGSYTCEVKNSLGSDRARGRLNVRDGIAITHPPEETTVTIGSTINLSCGVTTADILEVTIVWMKNYFPIIQDDRIQDGMSSLTSGFLQINDSIYEDAGLYMCQAEATGSLEASDMAYAEVVIQGPPDPPTHVRVSDPVGRKVRVYWKAGGYNSSPLKKIMVQYKTLHNLNLWITAKDNIEPEANKVELKLSPWVYYQFRVIVFNGVGNVTSPETRMIQTPPAAPDVAPRGVKARGLTPSTLTVTWQPLSKFEHNGPGLHYMVYYRPDGSNKDMNYKVVGDNTEVTIEGKSFFMKYQIMVQARNLIGNGPNSTVIYGITGERAPVGRPEDLEIQILSATSAYATWTGVEDNKEYTGGQMLGYKLYFWSSEDTTKPANANYKKTKETETPVQLNPFTNYRFQVFAYNTKGDGPGSNIIGPQTTPEDKPDEPVKIMLSTGAPKNPKDPVSLDTVTLQWDPPRKPNGIIIGYRVGVRRLPTGKWSTAEIPGLFTMYTFRKLDGGGQYEFSIEARTKRGPGPPATAIFDLFTIPRESPKNLKVSLNKDASEAVVSWDRVRTKRIDGYMVIYWVENKPKKYVKVSIKETKKKIEQMRRYKKYFFQVAAYQKIDDHLSLGPKSDAIIVDNGAAIRIRQSNDLQSDEGVFIEERSSSSVTSYSVTVMLSLTLSALLKTTNLLN